MWEKQFTSVNCYPYKLYCLLLLLLKKVLIMAETLVHFHSIYSFVLRGMAYPKIPYILGTDIYM